MTKKKKDQKSAKLAQSIIDAYQPESVEDMQEALKDVFGPMFEAMLRGELDNHLGYENQSRQEKETQNRRNGYGNKKLKTSFGELDIQVPRDRDASFEPEINTKRSRDVSSIE